MKKTRTMLTVALGAVCVAAACTSLALWNADTHTANAQSHTTEISMYDFDRTSFVFESSTAAAGGVKYSFINGESLSLTGKAGIAIRVKNLSGAEYNINQMRVYTSDSSVVYSPYNSVNTFYWMSGGVTTTSHTARYVKIPKDFDGYMFLGFAQMTVICTSGGSWIWTNKEHLSESGEGDFALPSGNCNSIAFYSLSSTDGKEIIFGGHTTYTVTAAGEYLLDDTVLKADIATAANPGSEPLMSLTPVPSLTCTFSGDEHVSFDGQSTSVPYGYTLTVPARFDAGYTQDTITVGEGESAVAQSTLAVSNTYREDTSLPVFVASKQIVLDSTARILDPDDNGTTSANYGGAFPLENSISGVGADGVLIRVRNTLNTVYTINTLYINGDNGVQYSLLNTLAVYVSTNGTVTRNRPASGATTKNRMAKIPALFDGYLVIPFSELVVTHVDSNISASSDWNRYEGSKCLKNSADPWLSFPKCNLTGINIYFTTGGGNEGVSELILGDFGTYVGDADAFTVMQTAPFSSAVESLTANGGVVAVTAFPETQLSVALTLNGKSVTSDETADLGVQSTQLLLTYGQALSLAPVTNLGYAITRIEYSGSDSGLLDGAVYVNLIRGGGDLILNFVTEETSQTTVSENDISLADKAGIKVTVDNRNGGRIDWRLVITDGETKYTASSVGAGLIEENGSVKYGNVFSVPADFSGTLYVPFNLYRGALYGGIQLLPFDYAEGGKPDTVTGKVYIDCLSGQGKEEIEAVFSGWEYVTALPAASLADTQNADLTENGDADFIGGTSVSPLTELTANNAGSGKAFRITPADTLSFAGAGFALRVRNISGAAFGLRVYVIASDNKTYVPQTENPYALIASDGSVVTDSNNNRNVIIPTAFDGTVVLNFAGYATDTAAEDLGQNVVREGLTVKYINLYSAGSSEGILVGNGAVIDYDGAIVNSSFGFATISENTPTNFTLREINSAPVTVDNENVVLSADCVIFGITAVTLTPAEGKLITDVTVPEECEANGNADGTYTVTIVRPIASAATEYALGVVTDDALTVDVSISGSGKVFYLGREVDGQIVVPLGGDYTLFVEAESGFEAAVSADGISVTADANDYRIPAGTTQIFVTFTRLQANIAVTVGENGSATLDGEALITDGMNVIQGVLYRLCATPEKGYMVTVTLNGEVLTADEDGYGLVIYEDGELIVSFTLQNYKIIYDLDRGTNGDNPTTYTVNDAVTFQEASKEGHTFLYWYVLENGEEKQISGIARGSTGDVTVYAKFEMNVPDAADAPSSSINIWVWLGPILGVAAVTAGVVTFILVRKKRSK